MLLQVLLQGSSTVICYFAAVMELDLPPCQDFELPLDNHDTGVQLIYAFNATGTTIMVCLTHWVVCTTLNTCFTA